MATSQRLSIATRSLEVRKRISLRIFKRSIAQLPLNAFLVLESTEQSFLTAATGHQYLFMSQNVSSSYSTLQSIDGTTLVRTAPVKGFHFNIHLAVVLRDCDMKCVLSSGDLRLLHGFQIMRAREEGKRLEGERDGRNRTNTKNETKKSKNRCPPYKKNKNLSDATQRQSWHKTMTKNRQVQA